MTSCLTKTTCPYCGVGCGVDATAVMAIENSNLITVAGDDTHPANHGRLCVKGSALDETTGHEGRLLYPMIKGQRVGWDDALDAVATGFQQVIEKHGPDAVAFYLSGQLLTEDYYVANKLMKGFIGSANVDTNSRLCMSSAVAGYKRAFGEDVVPCDYVDLETCDLLVMVGSNAAWTHPVLYQRIVAAKEARPDMRIVVIDPRRTATCAIADLHLAIAPGADTFLFVGLLNYLQKVAATDPSYIAAHTEGFNEALVIAHEFTIDFVVKETGLSAQDLTTFFQWFAATDKTVTFYSQGVNQSSSGTDKCNAIINCHLATGRIGRKGMGPFSITGQPNAMGGREVGGLANQLAAHMDFLPRHVERVGRFWKASRMAKKPGLKAVDLFDAIDRGEIKAVWIMATNPVVSMPDANRVRRALQKCELVVVSDCVAKTDTTVCADILLPATTWGEKDGTVTNSERRISRQRAFHPGAGESRHDWWIVTQVARRMGFGAAFDYTSPHQIFNEHAALSAFENEGEILFNIGGLSCLSAQDYQEMEPRQWPMPKNPGRAHARVFADGLFPTPSGKARFVAVSPQQPAQSLKQHRTVQSRQPGQLSGGEFILNTGRVRDQWHTMTRTAKSPRLMSHVDAPFVAVNPGDAAKMRLSADSLVTLHNARGQVCLQVVIDAGQHSGQLFSPMHWNDQFASNARICALIAAVTDPVSGQPESKYVPVSLQSVPVATWLHIATTEPLTMTGADYWVVAKTANGYRYQVALFEGSKACVEALLTQWLVAPCQIEYRDQDSGDYRALVMENEVVKQLIFVSSRKDVLPEAAWLSAQLGEVSPLKPWQLLAGKAGDGADKGRLVCSCYEVGEKQINGAIDGGATSVKSLGETLCCGTNCGSCIPELKVLIEQKAIAARIDAA